MKKHDCDYLIIIHRIFIDEMPKKGGADITIDYLLNNGNTICLVEHSLEGKDDSIFSIKTSCNNKNVLKNITIKPKKGLVRWLGEIIVTVAFVVKNFNYIPYCVAVDPLNVLQAVLLKKIGKVGRIYFHCVDYSERRFSNNILNKIYSYVYRFALNNSDICGVVSKPMVRKFASIIKDANKLYFIPNTRVFKERNIDYSKRNKYGVVTMSGRVDDKTNYKSIINVLAKLKNEFPKIQFKIAAKIEDYVFLKELEDYIGLNGLKDRVSFLGFFPDPADLEDVLLNSGVGMTAYQYDKVGYYMQYADSLKIREYASYGLPIIADSICDTAFEARENGCGFIADTEEDMEKAFRKLWSDDSVYQKYCNNSLNWARNNDKGKILAELVKKISERPYGN